MTPIARRTAEAQTAGLHPIATGAARTARGLVVVRAYAGAAANRMHLMIRAGGRDRWREVTLGAGARPIL